MTFQDYQFWACETAVCVCALLVELFLRQCLLCKEPTCGTSLVNFSRGSDCSVYLLSAALPSGTKDFLYTDRIDLSSFQKMIMEFHHK